MSTKGSSQTLPNCRDLSEAYPALIKPGLISRTACPVDATISDYREQLEGKAGLVLIDLRAEEEVQMYGQTAMASSATTVEHTRQTPGLWQVPEVQARTVGMAVPPVPLQESNPDPAQLKQLPNPPPVALHRVSVMERARFKRALLPRLPLLPLLQAAALGIWDGQASQNILLEQLNKGGLQLMYEVLLDSSGPELAAACEVVRKALEGSQAVLFYCKAGKDRTGLLAMLLLSLAGAPDSAIVADYHLSDAMGDMAFGSVARHKELQQVDRAVFSRAPEEAMRHCLCHVRMKYGSVGLYLERHGFSAEQQEQLRALMVKAR